MVIIGLTGGLASGKSTVSSCLEAQGAVILDADKISRDLTKKNCTGAIKIEKAFGSRYFINGELDRKVLADDIFQSEKKTAQLNRIIHTLVIKQIKEEILKYRKSGCKAVIIDAPLLIESGLNKMCDEVWLVTADENRRIEWAMKRSGLTYEQAKARINRQLPDSEKAKTATAILTNDKDSDNLCKQAAALYQAILKRDGFEIEK